VQAEELPTELEPANVVRILKALRRMYPDLWEQEVATAAPSKRPRTDGADPPTAMRVEPAPRRPLSPEQQQALEFKRKRHTEAVAMAVFLLRKGVRS
jgi:hypothetical protein